MIRNKKWDRSVAAEGLAVERSVGVKLGRIQREEEVDITRGAGLQEVHHMQEVLEVQGVLEVQEAYEMKEVHAVVCRQWIYFVYCIETWCSETMGKA